MLRFLLNALLVLLAARILVGLLRYAGGAGRIRDGRAPRGGQDDPGGSPPGSEKSRARDRAARPAVDRSAAIDVPYTEVEPGEGGGDKARDARGPEGRA